VTTCSICMNEISHPIFIRGDIFQLGTVMEDNDQPYCVHCLMDAPVIGPRIKAAVERAQDVFWASIGESFPEAKTGDFAPHDQHFFEFALQLGVAKWLQNNTALLPQEE